MFLKDIPTELIFKIFKKMHFQDGMSLSKTCKRFKNIFDDSIWLHYLNRDFPEIKLPADQTQYKAIYIKEYFNLKNTLNNLFAVIKFLVADNELVDIKTKFSQISSKTTIVQLLALHIGNTARNQAQQNGHNDIVRMLDNVLANRTAFNTVKPLLLSKAAFFASMPTRDNIPLSQFNWSIL